MTSNRIRVTVEREFAEKLFYEKVLIDWKSTIDNPNHGHTVKKALDSIKKYPANIEGYTELRRLNGIGDGIASRLDATWKIFREQFTGEEPRVHDIKKIKKGDTLPYLTSAQSGSGKTKVPFIHKNTLKELSGEDKKKADKPPPKKKRKHDAGGDNDNLNLMYPSSTIFNDDNNLNNQNDNIITIDDDSQQNNDICSSQDNSYITYDPKDYNKCELILIVDGRELGLKRNQQTIVDYLSKLNINYETRPLSVGDYLWLIKMPNNDEIILDYIIERKTWDDLKASIRQSRYHEQKQRLKKSGIRNVILIAEGSETSDRSLEQALASTSVEYKFFIQRTQNLYATAKFLASITQRLKERILYEQFVGLSFTSFQSESRKTKSITVSDLFIRQLTVIPLLSVEKAKIIVERFPTMRSLVEFYRNNKKLPVHQRKQSSLLMNQTLPQINKALSQQLALFFDT